ncbi:hypothetical protein D3C86_1879040 [compost metagenome]
MNWIPPAAIFRKKGSSIPETRNRMSRSNQPAAIAKLVRGAANETQMMSRFGLRRLRGSRGTGFA